MMNYKIQSLQPILDCFATGEQLSPTHIAMMLGKSKVLIHKYLKELVAQGKLKKVGLGSHVVYIIADATMEERTPPLTSEELTLDISYNDKKVLQDSFYKFAENGQILQGLEGFLTWCLSRNLQPTEKAHLYVKVKKHIDTLKNNCGVINATDNFSANVEQMNLDKVYYADQYNWMEFGRGKLAEMTFFAKQSQNLKMINDVIEMIILNIECLINKKHIDAIAITPPSIIRTNQLLKILGKKLQYLGLPFVKIVKYYPHNIPIPQKSLKTREQRKRNAQETILLDDTHVSTYKNILLIDDFVGSGGTLNETAGKLKVAGAKHVYGFAFVGNNNLKYEVINEI